nr:MAG: ORF1 [Torque teno midi virus]
MPFWWRRRRKPWLGRWRQRRYKTRQTRRRRRRRRYRRQRPRRTTYRRRRRHYKVRRKRKKIPLTQWQPESIHKCKIKGLGTIVLGADGKQSICYTVYKDDWTTPKTPGGGGFGVEQFSLQYLFYEYQAKNNIWTTSNKHKDLCRYTGCKFTVFRHPETDFIVAYDIQPPFIINKYTYMMMHPQMMLLRKKKRILLSTATNPKGKVALRLHIKPPKLMSNKWFFQQHFSKYGLVTLMATAANFRYSKLGCCNQNQIITLYAINPGFYKDSSWAQDHGSNPYKPYSTFPQTLTYKYIDLKDQKQQYTMTTEETSDYLKSVNIATGFFNYKVLRSYEIRNSMTEFGMLPIVILRYNPALDTGKGNRIYLTSVLTGQYNVPKQDELILEGYPLYMMLFGFTSYIKHVFKDSAFFTGHMICVESPALYRVRGKEEQKYYPLIDLNFIKGTTPWDSIPTDTEKKFWYPQLKYQIQSINQIVECGPYVPKYNETRNSTWECNYRYSFYFKWGGSASPDQTAENPKEKPDYDVPDKIYQGLQITNPDKEHIETIFRPWDYRRGQITDKAIKRMYEYLETDSDVSTDSIHSSPPQKKKKLPMLTVPQEENKKIKTCLQELCKENIYQEPEDQQQLYNLIQQQHQQQQQIKHNLMTLIADMSYKQKSLLYHTGLLN